VLPGQAITTRLFNSGSLAGGVRTYGFEVLNAEGQAAVKDGLAEVSG
jgi:hypothetical protein